MAIPLEDNVSDIIGKAQRGLGISDSQLAERVGITVDAVRTVRSGDLIGEDAVVHIVKNCNGKESGVYKFVPGATATTRTVLRSATELMLDALREVDEGAGEVAEGGAQ